MHGLKVNWSPYQRPHLIIKAANTLLEQVQHEPIPHELRTLMFSKAIEFYTELEDPMDLGGWANSGIDCAKERQKGRDGYTAVHRLLFVLAVERVTVGDLAGLRTLASGILKNDYRHLYIADIITDELFYGGSEAFDEETVATMRRVCDDVLQTAPALSGRTS